MGAAAVVALLATRASVNFLVVLYSINVFITFSLSQLGMVRHWWQQRDSASHWKKKLTVNTIGFLLTSFILVMPGEPLRRENGKDGVSAAGYRNGDGEHVIDKQRASGNNAGCWGEKLGCDEISATAAGEEFDDLRIADANDGDGQHGGESHDRRERNVNAEGFERFLRTVTGGRKSVGAEADPCEHSDERYFVKERFVR